MQPQQLEKRIEELRQEFAGYQPLPQDVQEKLDKKFRLEFNYNSNHIEGNTLTYGETELFLIFDKTTGNHDGREYEEMKGSDVALKMVQEHAADKERGLTEGFIKDLNKIILVRPYWANAITADGQATRREISIGDYKKHPNSVRLQSGEMFHYASPEETPALMGDLVAWYKEELEKNELHPIALAALLHYKFVRIHPFDDGNGRISRLLMNYVLYCHNLPPVIIKSANKKDYLFALNQADTGNLNAFVEYVAQQMLWSLDIAIKASKGESVEEQDDLEKEIMVWKKEIKSKGTKNAIGKSELIVREICETQIFPLAELIDKKMNIFKDIFKVWKKGTVVNDVSLRRGFIKGYSNITSARAYRRIGETFSLRFESEMSEYVGNLKNNLRVLVLVSVWFDKYKYHITFDGPLRKKEIIKIYSERLTEQEGQLCINDIVKDAFDYIKSNTQHP